MDFNGILETRQPSHTDDFDLKSIKHIMSQSRSNARTYLQNNLLSIYKYLSNEKQYKAKIHTFDGYLMFRNSSTNTINDYQLDFQLKQILLTTDLCTITTQTIKQHLKESLGRISISDTILMQKIRSFFCDVSTITDNTKNTQYFNNMKSIEALNELLSHSPLIQSLNISKDIIDIISNYGYGHIVSCCICNQQHHISRIPTISSCCADYIETLSFPTVMIYCFKPSLKFCCKPLYIDNMKYPILTCSTNNQLIPCDHCDLSFAVRCCEGGNYCQRSQSMHQCDICWPFAYSIGYHWQKCDECFKYPLHAFCVEMCDNCRKRVCYQCLTENSKSHRNCDRCWSQNCIQCSFYCSQCHEVLCGNFGAVLFCKTCSKWINHYNCSCITQTSKCNECLMKTEMILPQILQLMNAFDLNTRYIIANQLTIMCKVSGDTVVDTINSEYGFNSICKSLSEPKTHAIICHILWTFAKDGLVRYNAHELCHQLLLDLLNYNGNEMKITTCSAETLYSVLMNMEDTEENKRFMEHDILPILITSLEKLVDKYTRNTWNELIICKTASISVGIQACLRQLQAINDVNIEIIIGCCRSALNVFCRYPHFDLFSEVFGIFEQLSLVIEGRFYKYLCDEELQRLISKSLDIIIEHRPNSALRIVIMSIGTLYSSVHSSVTSQQMTILEPFTQKVISKLLSVISESNIINWRIKETILDCLIDIFIAFGKNLSYSHKIMDIALNNISFLLPNVLKHDADAMENINKHLRCSMVDLLRVYIVGDYENDTQSKEPILCFIHFIESLNGDGIANADFLNGCMEFIFYAHTHGYITNDDLRERFQSNVIMDLFSQTQTLNNHKLRQFATMVYEQLTSIKRVRN